VTDLSAATDPLTDRTGYDPAFLGRDVPVPRLATPEPTVLLPYLHFSVLFRPDRRFAAVTALSMDGARLVQIDRESDRWLFDPRLPAQQQTGNAVYKDNDLDRGHLVRRTSAVWGDTVEEAQRANDDTFYWTNAAPQAGLFNKGRELWLGLEDFVQDHADTFDRRLAVFAGPVLDPRDPPYRGIQVPLRFWKVVAYVQDGGLAATGYLLDQSPLVDDLGAALEAAAAAGEPPPLGAFRTFQVPIADIAALGGVVLDQLVAVDRMPAPPSDEVPAPGSAAGGWVQLRSLSDVVL
jgi:endonuclease G, mitochondrial